jgi:hypothetical protein
MGRRRTQETKGRGRQTTNDRRKKMNTKREMGRRRTQETEGRVRQTTSDRRKKMNT